MTNYLCSKCGGRHDIGTGCPACYPSLPVFVASKVAREIVARAISTNEFRTKDGFIKWGEVDHVFESEMLAASSGEVQPWDGQLQPGYERKLRMINEKFRHWPEPAASECCDILANG